MQVLALEPPRDRARRAGEEVRSNNGTTECEQTFDELYQRYWNDVHGLLAWLLDNHHDAEDVAQDVFILAGQHLDMLDPDQPVQEWLLRIAGNQAANFLKKRNRKKRTVEDGRIVSLFAVAHDQDYELDVPDHREASPEENAAQQEMSTRLRALVADLPKRDREVIRTLYFERMTQRAAAEAFGISRATLREINDRALERLRMELSTQPVA